MCRSRLSAASIGLAEKFPGERGVAREISVRRTLSVVRAPIRTRAPNRGTEEIDHAEKNNTAHTTVSGDFVTLR